MQRMLAMAVLGLVAAGALGAQGDMDGMDMKADAKGGGMQAAPGKTVELTGEVLDMDCFMNEGAKGKEHQSCAIMCLNNGAPVGLLTADGKAYFLTANEDKGKMKFYNSVREWGGDTAKITGVIQKRAGTLCLRVDGAEKQ
jgi:hypothetical protein